MKALEAAPYPSRMAAWGVVAILFLASILNTIDRSMLNFLIDPIRRDLHISDVQISLLQGLSFSIFFVAAGFPLGLLADRTSRVRLLMAGSFVWSAATIAAGLAPAYASMFAARLVVGFGEASLGPCAMPLISDSFPPARRGTPISLHLLGGSIASGLAALLIGWILRVAPAGFFDFVPGFKGLAPWRIAFVAAGALGSTLVLALALQPEPKRRGVALNAGGPLRLQPIYHYLGKSAAVFLPLYAGFATFSVAAWGMVNWAFAMLTRQYHLSAAQVAHAFGTNFVIAGAIGALLAGQVLDLPYVVRVPTARLHLLTVLPLALLPAACATLAPSSGLATLLVSSLILISPMFSIIMLRVLSEMMPNDMRGFSVALMSFAGSLIGGIGGPLLVATATEHLLGDPSKVGLSIMIVTVPALLSATVCYRLAARALPQDAALAQMVGLEHA